MSHARATGSSATRGGSSDENDIGAGLEKILSTIEHTGSFLTARSSQSGVNPGLHIPSIGQIGLPVSSNDAKAIIQSCHASPFGKGSETVIDDSVRKSWELNTDQFSIQNPAWKSEIDRLVGHAIEGLGLFACPTDIVAEPYKLLVYEEGAFFLPHKDSPKAEGMFGTLVVCLPSQHTGGELIATHKGGREVFASAPTSDFGYSSAAWYSDVTHEVKPVTSGYRVVLTYNLLHRPTAALLEDRDNMCARIISLFDHWENVCNETYNMSTDELDWVESSSPSCPSSLLFMLDHKYHSDGLKFSQLKGADQKKVAHLRKACKEKGFYLYLANVEKEVMGTADDDGYDSSDHHSIIEELDNSTSLSTIVDYDGGVVAESVRVDEALFIQTERFEDEPDEEDFSGFTGNEGVTATHFYRQTAVLVIPPTFLPAFAVHALKNGRVFLDSFISQIFDTAMSQPDNIYSREGSIKIARAFIADKMGYSNRSLKAKIPHLLLPCLIEIGELPLCEEMVRFCRGGFHPSTGRSIGKAIHKYGFFRFSSCLGSIFNMEASTMNQLELLFNVVSEYLKHSQKLTLDASSQMMEWHDTTLDRILSLPRKLSQEDGPKLVQLIEVYPIGNMQERVFSLLEEGMSESAFIVSFLIFMYGSSEEGKLDKGEVLKVFNFALPKLLPALRLERPLGDEGNVRSQSYRLGLVPRREPSRPDPFNPQNLTLLIKQCDALSIERGAVLEALTKCASELPEAHVEDVFDNVLLPFVHGLCVYLHGLSEDRPLEPWERDFASQILKTYFRRHVQAKPQPPANWARDLRISCRCDDCRKLQQFARDPHMEKERFRVAQARRSHLHHALIGTSFHTETTRNGSPHTLHVTKTNNEYRNLVLQWDKKLRNAGIWLEKFVKESHLVEIIGNENYQELQQLSQEGVKEPALNPTTAQSLNANAPGVTVIRKRSYADFSLY